MSEVITTPVSLSSLATASAKDCRKDFVPSYTAWKLPGMVEPIEEVISTRPSFRAAMSLSTRFARCTVDFTFRSIMSSSAVRSFWTNGPPQSDTGVERSSIHGAAGPLDCAVQALHALVGPQIQLNRRDVGARHSESVRSLVNRLNIRGHHQVIAMLYKF